LAVPALTLLSGGKDCEKLWMSKFLL